MPARSKSAGKRFRQVIFGQPQPSGARSGGPPLALSKSNSDKHRACEHLEAKRTININNFQGVRRTRHPSPAYEQRRVDLATFSALPASTWGHCSQVLCFIVWDTPEKEKVAKWSPAPASILEGFNEIYVVHGPQNPAKHGQNPKVAKSTRVFPPTPLPSKHSDP